MLPREVTAIETGEVILRVDGVRLGFDDAVSIPEKYLDCRIKTIGSDKDKLVLELQKQAPESDFARSVRQIGQHMRDADVIF